MTSLVSLVTWPGYRAVRSRGETFKMATVEEEVGEVQSEEVTFKSLVRDIKRFISVSCKIKLKPTNLMFFRVL